MRIEEDYVTFETAKLLREKGFNESTYNTYYQFDDGSVYMHHYNFSLPNSENDKNEWSCPTLQMTLKWLREVHGIFITIEVKGDPRMESFIYFKWSVAKYCSCQIERIDNGLHTPEDYWVAEPEEDESFEKTCDVAIRYCLKNLIKC